jgi:hypothetical protein
MTKSSRSLKDAAATKKKQCEYFFQQYAPIIIFTSPVVIVMGVFMATPPVALFVAALALTMQLMLHHC